jgi:hypothetical protein
MTFEYPGISASEFRPRRAMEVDGSFLCRWTNGLGGHAYDTWRRTPDNNTFWPLWLAKDVDGISIYTLAYEAPET